MLKIKKTIKKLIELIFSDCTYSIVLHFIYLGAMNVIVKAGGPGKPKSRRQGNSDFSIILIPLFRCHNLD
jgi:hypothetical protein